MWLPAGYGGGMSSAKAALESDTRLLAFEAGRKYGVRVNTISAGPLGSRAAKAIGFIDDMIKCMLPHLESPNPHIQLCYAYKIGAICPEDHHCEACMVNLQRDFL